MTVESVAGNITLQVHRDKGTFGQVSVFCFAQTLKNGANQGEDFNFNPRVRQTVLVVYEMLYIVVCSL